MNELEDLGHGRRGKRRRAFGEASHELVEEVLGADLEVEGKAAVLDEDVEELLKWASAEWDAVGWERAGRGARAWRRGCCGG